MQDQNYYVGKSRLLWFMSWMYHLNTFMTTEDMPKVINHTDMCTQTKETPKPWNKRPICFHSLKYFSCFILRHVWMSGYIVFMSKHSLTSEAPLEMTGNVLFGPNTIWDKTVSVPQWENLAVTAASGCWPGYFFFNGTSPNYLASCRPSSLLGSGGLRVDMYFSSLPFFVASVLFPPSHVYLLTCLLCVLTNLCC